MPMEHMGVAVGAYHHFARDDPDGYGSWYHGKLYLTLPDGQWECALDVATPMGLGVAYRIVDGASHSDLGPVGALADGWYELEHTATSGALDYVRTGWLQDRFVVRYLRARAAARKYSRLAPRMSEPFNGTVPWEGEGPFIPDYIDSWLELKEWLRGKLVGRFPVKVPWFERRSYPWVPSTGNNALDALEALLPTATRMYVFGQRYTTGKGVHNVHMNQGDPPNTQWWAKNGIWQDGAVVMAMPQGKLVAWQTKFASQSLNTDEQGHPI